MINHVIINIRLVDSLTAGHAKKKLPPKLRRLPVRFLGEQKRRTIETSLKCRNGTAKPSLATDLTASGRH